MAKKATTTKALCSLKHTSTRTYLASCSSLPVWREALFHSCQKTPQSIEEAAKSGIIGFILEWGLGVEQEKALLVSFAKGGILGLQLTKGAAEDVHEGCAVNGAVYLEVGFGGIAWGGWFG